MLKPLPPRPSCANGPARPPLAPCHRSRPCSHQHWIPCPPPQTPSCEPSPHCKRWAGPKPNSPAPNGPPRSSWAPSAKASTAWPPTGAVPWAYRYPCSRPAKAGSPRPPCSMRALPNKSGWQPCEALPPNGPPPWKTSVNANGKAPSTTNKEPPSPRPC